MSSQINKSQIRQAMRKQRLALNSSQLTQAANRLAKNAYSCNVLHRAHRVASYRAFAGEIGTHEIEQTTLSNANKNGLFLPKITNFRLGQMKFYMANDTQQNALGIEEPNANKQPINPHHLDVVLVPLVAFSRFGARIGMGAGFYDRAFAFRKNTRTIKRPFLIGLAHSFQESETLQPEPWDVPLDAIITDQELIIV